MKVSIFNNHVKNRFADIDKKAIQEFLKYVEKHCKDTKKGGGEISLEKVLRVSQNNFILKEVSNTESMIKLKNEIPQFINGIKNDYHDKDIIKIDDEKNNNKVSKRSCSPYINSNSTGICDMYLKNSLSVILPDESVVKNIKEYDSLEPFEKKMLTLLPVNSLNIKAEIIDKTPYLNGKKVFYLDEKGVNPVQLSISCKVNGKELIIDTVQNFFKGIVLMEGRYDNKKVFIKVFGKGIHINNKEYRAKIARELTRHIFVNSVSKDIGPEIYFITKDEKGNVFLIMEKLEFNLKALRKNPYKWIKTIYLHLLKLHKRRFYHTDPNSNNIIGYKLLDFAYIESGGMFFDDSTDLSLNLELKDITGFATALFYQIYAWNIKEDPILKLIADSFLYGTISKNIFFQKIYKELKKRNKVDLYTQFLVNVSLNKDKKYNNVESVLQSLDYLKNKKEI